VLLYVYDFGRVAFVRCGFIFPCLVVVLGFFFLGFSFFYVLLCLCEPEKPGSHPNDTVRLRAYASVLTGKTSQVCSLERRVNFEWQALQPIRRLR
jgi:hypothetical protein